ncbi:MAG: serine kinase [Rhodoplanes sp.]|uniref:HPr kinase/phosphorylase n=1 Tax=Rhodoplanes sp. TaxID=1968906 RepID=UPI00180DA0E4|nr:HPr kinase/phosphatase C-terminal domain-containing protein [Rhodoplanes sp.]NVO15440.1 serine kinase [Rhodoplanes sp.]
MTPTIHASAVLVGARAVLIRGPSGAGKSHLALRLIAAADGPLRFVRLVSDDRTVVEAVGGRLVARPAPSLAGLIEVRGLGLRRLPYEPAAVVGLVVDLADPWAERMPQDSATAAVIAGITLPRLGLAAGTDPLPVVAAALAVPPADCVSGLASARVLEPTP